MGRSVKELGKAFANVEDVVELIYIRGQTHSTPLHFAQGDKEWIPAKGMRE